jgi:hypothetical protein
MKILQRSGSRRKARALFVILSGAAVLASVLVFSITASADAGNPILGAINGSLVTNADGSVTVSVRGQWNWLSHNTDCNFDRAGAGLALVWNDPNEPGYTLSANGITVQLGVASRKTVTIGGVTEPDPYNSIDGQVHPADLGVEGGANSPLPGVTSPTYTVAQKFNDPAPTAQNTTHPYQSWKGGCGREPLTANPYSGHPYGSWGYHSSLGGGYSHTYVHRSDITHVCVNFYDVHGGGNDTSSTFQVPNGSNEIDVLNNGDNSVKTNAFNAAQGANCVFFPHINNTTAVTNVIVGSAISDAAFIGGAVPGATYSVTFNLYAPSDPGCSTSIFTSTPPAVTASSTGTATVTSGSYTTQASGDYHWTAKLFDSTGHQVDQTACGDTGETSHVNNATPTLTTTMFLGDIATLTAQAGTSGVSPTGSITFNMYANANCTAPAQYTVTIPLNGALTVNTVNDITNNANQFASAQLANGNTYSWDVLYSGDANNNSVEVGCGTLTVAGSPVADHTGYTTTESTGVITQS